jgi:hypothetical protein
LAVKPAPLDTGSFSPRPTDRDGFFLGICRWYELTVNVAPAYHSA